MCHDSVDWRYIPNMHIYVVIAYLDLVILPIEYYY